MWRRLLCRLGAKLPGGPGAAGLPCARPLSPLRLQDRDRPAQESTHAGRSWHGRHEQHKGFGCGNLLHRCIPLDAITWSALAVLALELAKQLPWLSSLKLGGEKTGLRKWYGQLAGLPSFGQSVLPTSSSSCSIGEKEGHFLEGGDSDQALKNPSCSKATGPEDYLSETGNFLLQPNTGPDSNSCLLQEKPLTEVASEVQHVFQDSISVALNILGLELMQDGQRKMAFSCFKLAADQNYSKAQFNVGLCYEHGRGTKKDMAKAILYYQRAAHQGHTMAKYRYAKWLLHHCPRTDNDSVAQEAMSLLDQAAAAGLTQQAQMGTTYLKNLEPGKQHLQMCSHMTTKKEKAAVEDLKPMQERMKMMAQENIAALQSGHKLPPLQRAISSSPCLQSLNQPQFSHLGQTAFSLLHSWSTGNLTEMTKSCTNCIPSPAFPDGLSIKQQPLVWSPVG